MRQGLSLEISPGGAAFEECHRSRFLITAGPETIPPEVAVGAAPHALSEFRYLVAVTEDPPGPGHVDLAVVGGESGRGVRPGRGREFAADGGDEGRTARFVVISELR